MDNFVKNGYYPIIFTNNQFSKLQEQVTAPVKTRK